MNPPLQCTRESLRSNAAIATMATGMQGVLGLLTVIHLAHALEPKAYGIFSYTASVVGVVSVLARMGIPTLLTRRLSSSGEPADQVVKFGLSVTTFTALVVLLTLLVVVTTTHWFLDYRKLLDIWALTLFPEVASSRWVFTSINRIWIASIIDLGSAVARYVLTVIFVHISNDVSVAVEITVGVQLFAFVIGWGLVGKIAGPVRIGWVRPAILLRTVGAGIPLGAIGMAGILYSGADTWILNHFRGPLIVGYYAAAYRPITFLGALSSVYSSLAFPIMSRQAIQDSTKFTSMVRTATIWVLAVGLPIGVGTDACSHAIAVGVFGPQFAPSSRILFFVIWTWVLGLTRETFALLMVATHREARYAQIFGLTGIINVGLMLGMVRWGGVGTAMALVGTQALFLAFSVRATQKTLALRELFRGLVGPGIKIVISSLIMGACVLGLVRSVSVYVAIGVGAVIYLLLVMWLRPLPKIAGFSFTAVVRGFRA